MALIADIKIGERHRKNMGDLASLNRIKAESNDEEEIEWSA